MLPFALCDLGDLKMMELFLLLSNLSSVQSIRDCLLGSLPLPKPLPGVVAGEIGGYGGLLLGLAASKHPTADLLWMAAGEANGEPAGVLVELGYSKLLWCL